MDILFVLLGFLLLFVIASAKKQKKQEPVYEEEKKPVVAKAMSSSVSFELPLKKVETPPPSKVIKPKKGLFFNYDWQTKNSLKKAFILSEVLKRKDNF